MNFMAALLLSISANLDTFTVFMSYGMKKVKIGLLTTLLIAFITSTGTFLSMYLGVIITKFISIDIATTIGSVMLIGIGLWFIIDYYKKQSKEINEYISEDINNVTYSQILSDPIKADKDKSGDIDLKESIALCLALTINNLGLGVAASIAGINIFLNTSCTFIVTILSIILGLFVGGRCIPKIFSKYTDLIAGIIIVILGFTKF